MKILIVNKFFYPRGGDCIVAMATRNLLELKGHRVRVFSMDHPDNISIPDARGYASAVSFAGGIGAKLAGAKRIFGMGDVRKAFARVLDEFRPDVVHLHNIHSYLSPIVGEMAARRGIRVVWTLHDYKLLCPAYSCRRPDGEICEECFHGHDRVVANRCLKGSLLQSVIGSLESRVWNRRRLEKFTSCFIAPSSFMRNKMLEGGYSASLVTVLHNFIDPAKAAALASLAASPRSYFCYVGRLSEEKGVETMLKAAADSGVPFKVAGDGPLAEKLRADYASALNIEFLGQLDAAGVSTLLAGAIASVVPSEWYENNPLSVIESLCAGTPVIGANIGGIPELITADDGVLFTAGNVEELTGILAGFSKRHPFRHEAISALALARFSREAHYERLMEIYKG